MIFMQCNNCALERGIGSHYRASTNLGPILHTWQCICWVSGLGYNPVKAGEQPSAGFFSTVTPEMPLLPPAPCLPIWAASPESKRTQCTAPSWLECSQEKTTPFCRVRNIFIYLGENYLGTKVYPQHMNLPRCEENQQHSVRWMREDEPPQDWGLHRAHY